MGHRFLSNFWGGLTLGRGTTSVHFQISGMYPSQKEELNIHELGFDKYPGKTLNTKLGTLSGPTDVLGFMAINFFQHPLLLHSICQVRWMQYTDGWAEVLEDQH